MVARTLGWGAMGPFVGTVGGLPGLSFQRMRNGFIGGLIGGLLGGFVFQSLASLPLFTGFQIRLIGFGLLGASIGFFVGLVGEVFKQAWVKVLVGRNEAASTCSTARFPVIGRTFRWTPSPSRSGPRGATGVDPPSRTVATSPR